MTVRITESQMNLIQAQLRANPNARVRLAGDNATTYHLDRDRVVADTQAQRNARVSVTPPRMPTPPRPLYRQQAPESSLRNDFRIHDPRAAGVSVQRPFDPSGGLRSYPGVRDLRTLREQNIAGSDVSFRQSSLPPTYWDRLPEGEPPPEVGHEVRLGNGAEDALPDYGRPVQPFAAQGAHGPGTAGYATGLYDEEAMMATPPPDEGLGYGPPSRASDRDSDGRSERSNAGRANEPRSNESSRSSRRRRDRR